MRRVVGGVVYGDDERVAAWVQDQLGGGEIAGPYQALGIENPAGELVFGVVFFNEQEADITIAMAATDMRPAIPSMYQRILDYPFAQLGLPRVSAEIALSNRRCVRFALGSGFRLEGVKRKAAADGGDVGVFGLLADECPLWRPRRESAETTAAH